MFATASLLSLDQAWTEVFPWVYRQLGDAGLAVKQTFDLQLARDEQRDCPCPHHGAAECNCQMLILLVYRGPGSPVTLIIHGYTHDINEARECFDMDDAKATIARFRNHHGREFTPEIVTIPSSKRHKA